MKAQSKGQTSPGIAAEAAARAIPPAWPLASSVAVNPFLGQTDERLADTAARLGRVAGLEVTMPRDWYRARLDDGRITGDDLAEALTRTPEATAQGLDVASVKAAAGQARPQPEALPDVATLAAQASGIDWPGLIAERLGHWAAGYFDAGQALWSAPRGRRAYAAWRATATHDLTPEIAGLAGFAAAVAEGPEHPEGLLNRATGTLELPEAAQQSYFHALLMSLGGWAQLARQRQWQAELHGGEDAVLLDLLAIRLFWEEALFRQYGARIAEAWRAACEAHARPLAPTRDQVIDSVLQAAAEQAAQRGLMASFEEAASLGGKLAARPKVQAAFCIDVRSEVFRRALESVDPGIETLGFAGFFGLAVSHRRFASDVEEARCPVLLKPGVSTRAGGADDATLKSDRTRRFSARATRAWGRFKLAAVSSFAFVEAMGPVYAGKLLRDSLGLNAPKLPHDPAPQPDPALGLSARIEAAATVLNAMSLTANFARVVVLAGHGANVVNNPHASALHCGACGGYSGEVNARLLAGLLNDPAVRQGLAERGIDIPADTLFVAALHDTTTDRVTLYDGDAPAAKHREDLDRLRDWLAQAALRARGERSRRLPRARKEADLLRRSRDWAEVRPEWGLAGCKAFVAAPRRRTAGCDLHGRAFLHSYDWRQDEGFKVLELILTAPVVVASWISLQYYGSTVAPQAFGGGNKLLHNVTGGVGVVEGNGGLLRVGLPWQSVHDGEDYAHEPLRLSVCIEAPREAISEILGRHDQVRALFDNGWLHLFAMDESGRLAWRYAGDLDWRACGPQVTAPAAVAAE